MTADILFTGGNVRTMDGARPRADAVAVARGRIVAAGTNAEVAAHVGPRTRRIDLHGRTLVPGFQDAHVHPSMAGIGKLADLVVLDRDLDQLDGTPLGDVTVLLTLIEGGAVFEDARLEEG